MEFQEILNFAWPDWLANLKHENENLKTNCICFVIAKVSNDDWQ